MKTLVVPDIHNKVQLIEPLLARLKTEHNYDNVVFTGDYFDSFHDTPLHAQGTAMWLKESLKHDNRIHIVGNHDMPYLFPGNDSLWCPGYTDAKRRVIWEILDEAARAKIRPAYFGAGWLFSHAGFQQDVCSAYMIDKNEATITPEDLVDLAEREYKRVKEGFASGLFLPGARFGNKNTGGITWCDYFEEFIPWPGIDQMVGHTPAGWVRRIDGMGSMNYCIDTGLASVALIDDQAQNVEFIKTGYKQ